MINIIEQLRLEAGYKNKKKDLHIQAGDIVAVTTSQYKNTKRKQVTKGICISNTKRVGYTTIRLRNVVAGEPVEQTFILESPIVNQVDTVGKTKSSPRAKKYYLRDKNKSESKV